MINKQVRAHFLQLCVNIFLELNVKYMNSYIDEAFWSNFKPQNLPINKFILQEVLFSELGPEEPIPKNPLISSSLFQYIYFYISKLASHQINMHHSDHTQAPSHYFTAQKQTH